MSVKTKDNGKLSDNELHMYVTNEVGFLILSQIMRY